MKLILVPGKCLHIGYCLDMATCCHCSQFRALLKHLDGRRVEGEAFIASHMGLRFYPSFSHFANRSACRHIVAKL